MTSQYDNNNNNNNNNNNSKSMTSQYDELAVRVPSRSSAAAQELQSSGPTVAEGFLAQGESDQHGLGQACEQQEPQQQLQQQQQQQAGPSEAWLKLRESLTSMSDQQQRSEVNLLE
ncbi:unnamed protein product [Polarella glacialis]|uniref:Uncharacterized protein n=1 Tax=Polarella glacialis TaxID=89957 RepID=A0A813H0M8_POLGL|nr:unnamed protein product [Polarella glacialis]